MFEELKSSLLENIQLVQGEHILKALMVCEHIHVKTSYT